MMKNLNIVVDSENSLVYPDRKVVGINNENLQGYIIFSFKNGFVDGTAWLEIQMPDGKKGYLAMTKEEETYKLPIKSSILAQKGKIFMNLRVTEGKNAEEIPVFKSKVFYEEVLETLNTTEEIPEQYESWIDIANEKINEINKAIQEVDNIDIDVEKVDKTTTVTVTTKDGTKKEVEIKDYELTEEDKQEIVNATIDEIQPQFDNIQEELSQIDKDIVNVDNRVKGLQEDLQEQEENINHLDDIKANKTELETISTKIEEVNTIANTAQNKAEEAELIAKGRATGYVFNTKADMDLWLQDTEHTSILNQGDNLYIIDKNVPDYWWDGTQAQELETQKVDLTEYVKNTDYATNNKGGVLKSGVNGFQVSSSGNPNATIYTYEQYEKSGDYYFIGKGTLENAIVGKELINKTQMEEYVDEIVGNIDTILTRLTVGEGVE